MIRKSYEHVFGLWEDREPFIMFLDSYGQEGWKVIHIRETKKKNIIEVYFEREIIEEEYWRILKDNNGF